MIKKLFPLFAGLTSGKGGKGQGLGSSVKLDPEPGEDLHSKFFASLNRIAKHKSAGEPQSDKITVWDKQPGRISVPADSGLENKGKVWLGEQKSVAGEEAANVLPSQRSRSETHARFDGRLTSAEGAADQHDPLAANVVSEMGAKTKTDENGNNHSQLKQLFTGTGDEKVPRSVQAPVASQVFSHAAVSDSSQGNPAAGNQHRHVKDLSQVSAFDDSRGNLGVGNQHSNVTDFMRATAKDNSRGNPAAGNAQIQVKDHPQAAAIGNTRGDAKSEISSTI